MSRNLPIGVQRAKSRFRCELRHKGKKTHIGTFDTPEEARAAYDKARHELGIPISAWREIITAWSRDGVLPWFDCSKCFAHIGLTHHKAETLLKLSRGTVARAWKSNGITTNRPECGNWGKYSTFTSVADAMYESARKQDIKATNRKGFDWGVLWKNEKYNRYSKARYHSMTNNEKKAHNRRCAEKSRKKRQEDPEAKDRYNRYQKEYSLRPHVKVKQAKYQKEYVKRRKRDDPSFRALHNVRDRFKKIMRRVKLSGGSLPFGIIGCSPSELKYHLESQFTKDMSWDNYGTHWHVDHILPCASFDHSIPSQVKQCWHYLNLQPLGAAENLKKSDQITEPQMQLILNQTP